MKDTAGGSGDRTGPTDTKATVPDTDPAGVSLSTAALVAGAGLLVMAVLSALSIPFLVGVVVTGEPGATASNVLGDEFRFRFSIAALVGVVALDVVVAWALYVFLRPVNKGLSLLAALFRVSYAAILAAAVGNLVDMLDLLTTGAYAAALGTTETHALALAEYVAFTNTWDVGLAVFGVHLLAVGYLTFEADYVPAAIGVLVAIAGLGYVIDSLGALLVANYGFELAMVTFIGEVVLLAWLLYKGRTIRRPEPGAS